jgi:hypothetical protein
MCREVLHAKPEALEAVLSITKEMDNQLAQDIDHHKATSITTDITARLLKLKGV